MPRQANYAQARDEDGAMPEGAAAPMEMDQEEVTGRNLMADLAAPPPQSIARGPMRSGGPPGGPPPAPAAMAASFSAAPMPEMAKRRSVGMALGGMLQQGYGGAGPRRRRQRAPRPWSPRRAGWTSTPCTWAR